MSTFVGGFIIAFVKGWLLTLVMLSCLPCIIIGGVALSWMITNLSSHGQVAYSEAANIVDQTIGCIRTVSTCLSLLINDASQNPIPSLKLNPFYVMLKVVSFTGEERSVELYKKCIKTAYRSSVQEGLASGLGHGILVLVVFFSYALATWYGAKLIIDKGYNGGVVINVMIVIMVSGM